MGKNTSGNKHMATKLDIVLACEVPMQYKSKQVFIMLLSYCRYNNVRVLKTLSGMKLPLVIL